MQTSPIRLIDPWDPYAEKCKSARKVCRVLQRLDKRKGLAATARHINARVVR
ncbi:MAG: hypothetical protein Hens2KO_14320 [Henriciella sp.]